MLENRRMPRRGERIRFHDRFEPSRVCDTLHELGRAPDVPCKNPLSHARTCGLDDLKATAAMPSAASETPTTCMGSRHHLVVLVVPEFRLDVRVERHFSKLAMRQDEHLFRSWIHHLAFESFVGEDF